MKKQLLKSLFAFIVMMFSIYFLNAQCNGNQVQLYWTTRSGACISKCVPPSQVQKYFAQGWRYSCGSYYPAKSNSKGNGTKSPVILANKIQAPEKEEETVKKKLTKYSAQNKIFDRLKIPLRSKLLITTLAVEETYY